MALAVDLDGAAVRVSDPLGDREPKAGALLGVSSGCLATVESVKDAFLLIGSNPDSLVGHRRGHCLWCNLKSELDRAAFRRIFYRIVDEIEEQLAQPEFIASHLSHLE